MSLVSGEVASYVCHISKCSASFSTVSVRTYEFQTGHSTTGLVSAAPPSIALSWPLVSFRRFFFADPFHVEFSMT